VNLLQGYVSKDNRKMAVIVIFLIQTFFSKAVGLSHFITPGFNPVE